MPSAKDGKACTVIAPMTPKVAEAADVADPGEVEKVKAEQRKTKSGKYGSVETQGAKPLTQEEKEKKVSWIEIKLVDEEGEPVPGELYRITLPDGSVVEGTLDAQGFARVDGLDPGSCKVTFPRLDERSWKPR